ncbi:hypothetical protein CW304_11845 [Bacillus sp. UFRGS-B20]|nr:hypothetical protein CW304_11845 [Bacillus sp. UFRGS-B20]
MFIIRKDFWYSLRFHKMVKEVCFSHSESLFPTLHTPLYVILYCISASTNVLSLPFCSVPD